MIVDTFVYNADGILLVSLLLYIFCLNDRALYFILIVDIILNGIPFITFLIILLYYLNKMIFRYINNSFINMFIMIIIYYFLFGITIFSIYNQFNIYIIKMLLNNAIYNIIYYFFGLLYIRGKYNLMVNYEE